MNIFRILGWSLIIIGLITIIVLSGLKVNENYSYYVLIIMIIGLVFLFINRFLSNKK